ncbi:MAG: hypothetical protein HY509_04780 [Acidobacteria bacterium]|nr:hypothetical protein [Acidobacteriota bacterium]
MQGFASMILGLAVMLGSANSASAGSRAASAFERLKSLAGEWHGRDPEGNPVRVSYAVVSGGSALVETLAPAKEPSMVTVYHLDGDRLMMTHYCGSGNQPRMLAEVPAGEIQDLTFAFLDATNLAKPSDGHMESLAFTFPDGDHVSQVWTWSEAGKKTETTFDLERKQ